MLKGRVKPMAGAWFALAIAFFVYSAGRQGPSMPVYLTLSVAFLVLAIVTARRT